MNFLLRIKPLYFFAFTFLLSCLMHLHVFRTDLIGYHVWRQTQTQLTIENFYKDDFNILNPQTHDVELDGGTQRQEFPLMQWIFACFYRLLGDHLIITRILSFILGIFSVIGIYYFLKNVVRNRLVAMIGAWAFNFSPVFYYYTLNPLPDNFALCCGIWGLAYFTRWVQGASVRNLVLTGAFLSLAALTKLPFILYFIFPFAYLLTSEKPRGLVLVLSVFLIPPACWYLSVLSSMAGNPVILGILGPDKMPLAGILDILQFNLISTLPELLVNYGAMLFFVSGLYFVFRNRSKRKEILHPLLWLSMGLVLYFIFEMKQIAKVHDYYLFPFLPLIFITVTYGCYRLLTLSSLWEKACLLLLLILPLTAFIRSNSRWDPERCGFNADLLNYKAELRVAVPDSALCMVGNDHSKNIFYYYLQKKGWAFDSDSLTPEKLNKAMRAGVTYLYSDTRNADERPDIVPFLDTLIAQKGSIRVYRLKPAAD